MRATFAEVILDLNRQILHPGAPGAESLIRALLDVKIFREEALAECENISSLKAHGGDLRFEARGRRIVVRLVWKDVDCGVWVLDRSPTSYLSR